MRPFARPLNAVLLRHDDGKLVVLDQSFMVGLKATMTALAEMETTCQAVLMQIGEPRTDRERVLVDALASLVNLPTGKPS